jgi:LPXTG-motif cell wall-anchored protein
MDRIKRALDMAVAIVIGGLLTGAAAAQSTTTKEETKQFEIVSVDGNKVVVKGDEGAKEITVSDDFRLTVDGQPLTVRDLKPGMKGTARITTKTTVVPVQVTEVKNGEVLQVVGNSVLVRTAEGNKMFSESDLTKRGVKITVDGQPVPLSDLRKGTKLTATIVTTKPPKVLTEREVNAAIQAAPRAAPPTIVRQQAAPEPAPAPVTPDVATPPPPPPSSTVAAASAAPAATSGRLPKTASPLPLIALVGLVCAAAGLTLTSRRRRTTRSRIGA